jgi:DNA-binding beta-propeller fold protein YncE
LVSSRRIAAHSFIDLTAIQASGTKVFISDSSNNVVNIYNTSGKQVGQLAGFNGPGGLATDGKGNLYVVDTGNSRIQIYAPPYNKKPKTLSDPSQYPTGVSVLNDGQFVAVTNISGSVILYKNGKAGPPISAGRLYFCAFDARGDLFFDGENSNGNFEISEIANLTKGGKTLKTLAYNGTILFPGGIQVTSDGKIAIDDQEAASIYTFDPPENGSLGSPIATTPLTGSSDPVTFVFTKNNKELWDVDAGLAHVDEFAYPAGGDALKSIPVAGSGVAVVPAEIAGK